MLVGAYDESEFQILQIAEARLRRASSAAHLRRAVLLSLLAWKTAADS
jgi:hypothetical protein